MNKFFSGLCLGVVVGAGGTVAVIMRSKTVRRLAQDEVAARLRDGIDAFLYGPADRIDPADYETFVEYKEARESARATDLRSEPLRAQYGNARRTQYGPGRFSR